MTEQIVETSALDARLARTVRLDWEKVAWIALVVFLVVTRMWQLGDRAMSHDESLHTFYSWKLQNGEGYRHDPMMHGPLLYHATALSYFLFGANDATARLLGVVTGIALALSPLLVRKWLGRWGAFFAGLALALSPTVMYYSRYIRHDIPVELFTVLLFVSFLRFVDSTQGRWLIVALAAGAAAITSAEMSYINGFVLALFVVVAMAAERLGRRGADGMAIGLAGGGMGLLVFALLAQAGTLGEVSPTTGYLHTAVQLAFMLGGVLLIYGVVTGLFSRFQSSVDDENDQPSGTVLADLTADRYFDRFESTSAALQLLLGGGGLVVAAYALKSFLAGRVMQAGLAATLSSLTPTIVMTVGAVLFAIGIGALIRRVAGARVNVVIFLLGALVGVAGLALAPRVGEAAGGGLLAGVSTSQTIYAAVVGLAIAAYGFLGWVLEDYRARRLSRAIGSAPGTALAAGLIVFAVIYVLLFTTFFSEPDKITGFVDSLRYWWEQHDVQRGGQPWYYYLLFVPMYEFAWLFLALAGTVVYMLRPRARVQRGNDGTLENPTAAAKLFVPMVLAWGLANFWIYSWAGEKMPWLIVHLIVPFTFLAGRFMGDLIGAFDWAQVRRDGWKVGLLTILVVVTTGAWLAQVLSPTEDRMAATVVGVGVVAALAWALYRVSRSMSSRQTRLMVAFAGAIALMVVNARYALMANFVNDELANEYIVYAHGTPDDKLVYDTLKDMQLRLGAEDPLKIGYDNEVSWPFTWYFRAPDWYSAEYLAENPSSIRDHDVVLVGDPNYDKFHPYLRDRYDWVDYRRMWWPNEGYKGLTWAGLIENLTDPALRSNLLNILIYRRYRTDARDPASADKPLTDWYHHANMRMYVKKDLLERLWPLAQNRPEWASTTVTSTLAVDTELPVDIRITEAGGSPIVSPKDVAVAPDGSIVIVDHGNGRIVVTDEQGQFLSEMGEGLLRDAQNAPSAWGVGVAPDGAVYVADTWNHRILKFVDGELELEWGSYGEHKTSPQDGQTEFFGPRDVAVAGDGTVWVTDTGNSRVIQFSSEGEPLQAIGGDGVDPGQFREPVAIAIDPATGDFFVADLWNYRIQRFDSSFTPVSQWVVEGWDANSAADDKAYLAVGPGSTVVVTDPAGKRAWVFDNLGKPLATLDVLKDEQGLDKPIGVAVDALGRILISSHNQGLVTRYGVLESMAPASAEQGADAEGPPGGEGANEAGGDSQGEGADAGGPSPTAGGDEPTPTPTATAPSGGGPGVSPTATAPSGGGASPSPTATGP